MQLMAWVRTGWLQLGVWWSHLRIESVISIQEGKKSKYTGSLRNQLLMFHTTVFIKLNAADESKITNKRRTKSKDCGVYSRIIRKNSAQLGNLHHPDYYDSISAK